jgi:hypothetical protein
MIQLDADRRLDVNDLLAHSFLINVAPFSLSALCNNEDDYNSKSIGAVHALCDHLYTSIITSNIRNDVRLWFSEYESELFALTK